MVTVTSQRTATATLDPHLFTFKPKLNEKSTQLAQNLLSDFYERQLNHVQRLQELKEEAAIDYRQWYCHIKAPQLLQPLPQIISTNRSTSESKPTTADSIESCEIKVNETSSSLSLKEARQSNVRRSRSIRPYRPLLTSKATQSTPPAPSSPPLPRRKLPQMSPSNRSKSPSKLVRQADPSPKRSTTNDTINTERLKLARDEAERAMKDHKIFTIIGPYPALRECLRRRGWIEKFYRGASLPAVHGKKSEKKNNKSDDDEDDENEDDAADDDLDEHQSYEDDGKIPPWEENDGYYGLLSRLVRTAAPNLIWSVRASYDTNSLHKDQMVNHYSRNGCFTTKTGLCSSLRNLPWFHSGCAEEFFPRCYKLSHEDDKVAFMDDYRLTTCMSFLKLVQNRCKGVIEPDMSSILAMSSDNVADPRVPPTTNEEEPALTRSLTIPPGQLSLPKLVQGKVSSTKKVPSSTIEFALNKVNDYTLARDHGDIDISADLQPEPSDEQWTQFIEQFYLASHSNVEIEGMEMYINRIDECLKNVQNHWPQYHIDGTRNIWILKPGAKSRGRGIVVYDRLEDILKLCSSTLTKDGKFVVQKYIERPLLIHNTKFDIRQWFLVTDWNPLTIWMFKDCYLRFCTEHFSLETRQQSVHLCNYSIQKHYKNNSNRHGDLPVENMWTNTEFIEKYLRPSQLADRWDEFIYPAMKDAIICSMFVAQDAIDTRKNSFELFGADFMLGEDLKPWLIEINCSPTMARCTAVTAELCDGVLEDTCKVMIDRKYNRTADTGRFELIHRGTPVPVPIYIGIDLRVEGKPCKTGRMSNNCSTNITATQNTTSTTNLNSNTNNNPVIMTPISVPPPVDCSSSPSSLSTSPAEARSILPHPASALTPHCHSLTSKTTQSPASFKFRRELTQPALNRLELLSSSDYPMGRTLTSESLPFPYRSTFRINATQPPLDIRAKPTKPHSNRLSVEYLPARHLSRPKITDRLPSPKGNSDKSSGVSKINVLDFLFKGKGIKSDNQYSFFRPYQRSWLLYKSQQQQQPASTTNLLKPYRHPKTITDPSNYSSVSALSLESTIAAMSTVDPSSGHNPSTSSIVTVA